MEQIPQGHVLSVLEGADAAGLSTDGLTFAITANDGVSIAYLVQLPAGSVNNQLLAQQILNQAGLLLETKPDLSEESTSDAQLVTENNNDSSTNNNAVVTAHQPILLAEAGSSGGLALSAEALGLQPLQIQFVEADGISDEHKCEVVDFLELGNHPQPQLTMVTTSESSVNFSLVNNEHSVEEVEQKFVPDSNVGNTAVTSQLQLEDVTKSHEQFNGEVTHVAILPNDLIQQSSPNNVPQSSLADDDAVKPDLNDMKFVVNVSKGPVRTYGKGGAAPPPKVLQEEEQTPFPPGEDDSIVSHTKLLKLGPIIVSDPERITFETVMGCKPDRPKLPNKKRRLIIDANKQIPVTEFRSQLQNTKDITSTRGDLAPSTKKAMRCLENGGVARFFSSPGRPITNVPLSRLFSNHLVMVTEAINGPSTYCGLVPLTADLRIDRSPENGCAGSNETDNAEHESRPATVRLINIGKPGTGSLQSIFKGLHRPLVFKRYKYVKRETALGSSLVKNKILRGKAGKQALQDNKTATTTSIVTGLVEGEDIIKEESYIKDFGDEVLFTPNEKLPLSTSMNCNGDQTLPQTYLSGTQHREVDELKIEDDPNNPLHDPLESVLPKEELDGGAVDYILGKCEQVKEEPDVVDPSFFVDAQLEFEGSIVEPCDVQTADLGTLQVEASPS
ncbi:Double-strand-break repair protein rad21 [Orchesella cincta]|uniref:Double-strand-break repair protein rad21 n=1 Tax=Orchesella cincta TaxID=48709 RepID=A0A1D2MSP4_ORCCI|nr:Double-strand-break repair protein rad21 [Orchesella cincta]